MVDFKIGIAVFGTLLLIAIGMTGNQDINLDPETQENEGITDFIPTEISEIFGDFSGQPEPNNTITAEFQVDNLQNKTIEIENANLTGQNLTEIKADDQEIQTQTPIMLEGFTGSAALHPVQIQGQIEGYKSENMQTSGNQQVTVDYPLEDIQIYGNAPKSLNFERSIGIIESGSDTINFNSTIDINVFEGDIIVTPEENRVQLEGKVDTLETDQITID